MCMCIPYIGMHKSESENEAEIEETVDQPTAHIRLIEFALFIVQELMLMLQQQQHYVEMRDRGITATRESCVGLYSIANRRTVQRHSNNKKTTTVKDCCRYHTLHTQYMYNVNVLSLSVLGARSVLHTVHGAHSAMLA